MRLSDAGLRRRPTKLIYLNHRLPPWLTEVAAPRSLEPIVMRSSWQLRTEDTNTTSRSVSHPNALLTKMACHGRQPSKAGIWQAIIRPSFDSNQASFAMGAASLP